MELNTNLMIITGIGSCIAGYLMFLVILKMLPKRLRADNLRQKEEIIREAKVQAESILANARLRAEDKVNLMKDDLEEALHEKQNELEFLEQEFKTREELLQEDEARIEKEFQEVERGRAKVARLEAKYAAVKEELKGEKKNVITRLSSVAKVDQEQLTQRLKTDIVEDRQLQSQKVLKTLSEELEASSKRRGERMLSRLMSRYQPQFIWPKAVNHVELKDKKVIEMLEQNDGEILRQLKELAEVEVELQNEEDSYATPMVKFAGGFGLNREAGRLTLEALVNNPTRSNFSRYDQLFKEHLEKLNIQAISMGQRACHELQLSDMHVKIQRLIGCLNWRTSYRQNQFYHSLEVAKLAGVLAFELGVDPQEARRCGILHDIGKALDYNIDGSHAVISGDYADRYGESKLICDTVMSHHNDIVLETPMSFVLKSADTLSGARPGARVNLEAGYHGRLTGIDEAVNSFPGIAKVSIMNGGREVHVEVNHKKVKVDQLETLTAEIAKKISEDVAFPGQIKVLISRKYESVAVA